VWAQKNINKLTKSFTTAFTMERKSVGAPSAAGAGEGGGEVIERDENDRSIHVFFFSSNE